MSSTWTNVPASRWVVLVLSWTLLGLAGCDWYHHWRLSRTLESELRKEDELQKEEMALASTEGTIEVRTLSSVDIAVRPGGVRAHNFRFVESVLRLAPEATADVSVETFTSTYMKRLSWTSVDPRESKDDLLVEPLHGPLTSMVEANRTLVDRIEDGSISFTLGRRIDRVTLWVDREVPYGELSRVLYTLGQASLGDIQFRVSPLGDDRALDLYTPNMGSRLQFLPVRGMFDVCLDANIRLGADGLFVLVSAHRIVSDSRASSAPKADPTRADSAPSRYETSPVDFENSLPSSPPSFRRNIHPKSEFSERLLLPRRDARYSVSTKPKDWREALVELLEAAHRRISLCRGIKLSVPPSMPWRRIAPVVSALDWEPRLLVMLALLNASPPPLPSAITPASIALDTGAHSVSD